MSQQEAEAEQILAEQAEIEAEAEAEVSDADELDEVSSGNDLELEGDIAADYI